MSTKMYVRNRGYLRLKCMSEIEVIVDLEEKPVMPKKGSSLRFFYIYFFSDCGICNNYV